MQRFTFTILVFLLLNYACKHESSHTVINETKDSILRRYLSLVDKLPYYDTSVTEFKLLKAYTLNDTNALSELSKKLEEANKKSDYQIYSDSCVKEPEFQQINADEKYRFIYGEAFCRYITLITVVKNNDSIRLRTIIYRAAWDTTSCKIVEQSTVPLDSLQWAEFKETMEVADFWGLKSDNGNSGYDGSTLTVVGFKKGTDIKWNPDKLNLVDRWVPYRYPIMHCFVILLEYSGTIMGCSPYGFGPEMLELSRTHPKKFPLPRNKRALLSRWRNEHLIFPIK